MDSRTVELPNYGTIPDLIAKAVITRRPNRHNFSLFTLDGIGFESSQIKRALHKGRADGWLIQ